MQGFAESGLSVLKVQIHLALLKKLEVIKSICCGEDSLCRVLTDWAFAGLGVCYGGFVRQSFT